MGDFWNLISIASGMTMCERCRERAEELRRLAQHFWDSARETQLEAYVELMTKTARDIERIAERQTVNASANAASETATRLESNGRIDPPQCGGPANQ